MMIPIVYLDFDRGSANIILASICRYVFDMQTEAMGSYDRALSVVVLCNFYNM